MGFFLLILDVAGRYQVLQQWWHDRNWFIELAVGFGFPPWLQAVLIVSIGLLLLWAIYELQTRPPMVLPSTTRYAIGQRTVDLIKGIVDLDETPEELMKIHEENTGIKAAELTRDKLHKFIKVSGTFLNAHVDERFHGSYDVHISLPGGRLIFARMNEIDDHDQLKILNKGDQISLRGRIIAIHDKLIQLEAAQFMESRHHELEYYSDKPKGPPIKVPPGGFRGRG